ncbi:MULTISPECIES: aspartyl protease family protein [unclassified Mucilaginibacter]|uniref:aspartyl protease family protein n=1 Tax=unclassified Mucilaginibacter TaxID=2617802 RepID=UPI002AC9431F|nr:MULTISPECIES: aspartyl protease family protein [unclassified Mucilaginibacter]MEB0263849.1 aspartyl protease family protein [Mucilaginibacter sp. 10I4]MEB0278369.1 aspartyl protease family protein [Mucilaginibacter sp. 10B2]MEB0301010.1 aspartyl protease family protein [Mucilaginibacter sp. 5C4]WPX24014.1 aspartyl protease family protein [Mucilaginibacter sp. 5C4]
MLAGLYKYSTFKQVWLFVILNCLFLSANAQSFDVDSTHKYVDIPFKLVRNMMIVKVKINNKGPFNFILDTGVGLMIITEPKLVDSIGLASKRTIKLAGLGEGDAFEAYVTPALNVGIPGLVSDNVSAAILKTDYFNLSGYVGMPIHGLLGYEFFNSLAVKINFTDTTMNVCRPKNLKPFKKSQKIPISIEDKKPYMQTNVSFPDGTKAVNKFVIDLGAGHPLSIENMVQKHGLPKKAIQANLGVGLNGPITGYLSRVKEIDMAGYKIKNIITSFPDKDYVQRTVSVPRDGNLGIGILKRFNLAFDYTNGLLYVKSNEKLNVPFEHDMSGIEYFMAGENYLHLIVGRIAPGSPADEIGLIKDDEITSINFKPVSKMTAEEIDGYFKTTERSLLLEIYHDKKYDRVIINLRRRI